MIKNKNKSYNSTLCRIRKSIILYQVTLRQPGIGRKDNRRIIINHRSPLLIIIIIFELPKESSSLTSNNILHYVSNHFHLIWFHWFAMPTCLIIQLVSGTPSDNTSKTNAYYYLMATLTLEALLDEGSRYILSVPRSYTQLSIPIYPCHKNMQGLGYVCIQDIYISRSFCWALNMAYWIYIEFLNIWLLLLSCNFNKLPEYLWTRF